MSKNFDAIKAIIASMDYDYTQLEVKAFGQNASSLKKKYKEIRVLAQLEVKSISEEAKKAKEKAKKEK